MPEESKESKAQKLAAARKKLKEYQQRGTASSGPNTDSASNSGHVSSNVSERSESELQLNGSSLEIDEAANASLAEVRDTPTPLNIANYFGAPEGPQQALAAGFGSPLATASSDDLSVEVPSNINAIQVLITEKAQLTTELTRSRTSCREKDLELEELRVQYTNVSKRLEDLQQQLREQQKQAEQSRHQNAELQHKLAQARAQNEDQSAHVLELQQQLQIRDERQKTLDHEYKEKCNELELSQLRVRQLSDENSITKDNRVESLTQTQFMYEQQIRDLQAMVQQLTHDKEQANNQYQTYIQQLNAQVSQLNERNTELIEECSGLRDRDKQMVDHIQQLERDIQKNIARQQELKDTNKTDESSNPQQVLELTERIQEFETERYEFQLKIKSQEDRLLTLQTDLQHKQQEIIELREHLENVTSEQPDKTKLLAVMESDKVAASRALSQNAELKKQLDELEMRFVQLTNDKADLMNRLDAELYANREMHANYGSMEERLRSLDEKFKFKDEEMIRLSHENEELKKKNVDLLRRHGGEAEPTDADQHHHHHFHDHATAEHESHECDGHKHDHALGHQHDDHHDHPHNHLHDGTHVHHHEQQQEHGHKPDTTDSAGDSHYCRSSGDVENGEEATEVDAAPHSHINPQKEKLCSSPPHLATEEAVEKLQQRFTHLMSQVADLTEEKQRLEHLVMQLQSETETIGEYIALYQTQRRILKQREYEKAAQTALLQAEREQMQHRLTLLNNLVNSLGMEMPNAAHRELQQHLSEALATDVPLANAVGEGTQTSPTAAPSASMPAPSKEEKNIKDLNSLESQEILHKIQDIITEIKENTKDLPSVHHSVDHLNCCSGKFEVV